VRSRALRKLGSAKRHRSRRCNFAALSILAIKARIKVPLNRGQLETNSKGDITCRCLHSHAPSNHHLRPVILRVRFVAISSLTFARRLMLLSLPSPCERSRAYEKPNNKCDFCPLFTTFRYLGIKWRNYVRGIRCFTRRNEDA